MFPKAKLSYWVVASDSEAVLFEKLKRLIETDGKTTLQSVHWIF